MQQQLENYQDRVFTVNSGYWIFGNVLATNAILDDLEQDLLDSPLASRSEGYLSRIVWDAQRNRLNR